MLEEIQSFIKTSWMGLAFAIFLLIAGWKMNAPIANWLLIIAWAILVGTFYRTPFVTNQTLIPMCLLVTGFGAVIGLVIYYSLWTTIEKTPLGLAATTSTAERQRGAVVAGISWLPKFGELRIWITNNSKLDYQNVDLALIPDLL
jgi:hypothetical protein